MPDFLKPKAAELPDWTGGLAALLVQQAHANGNAPEWLTVELVLVAFVVLALLRVLVTRFAARRAERLSAGDPIDTPAEVVAEIGKLAKDLKDATAVPKPQSEVETQEVYSGEG